MSGAGTASEKLRALRRLAERLARTDGEADDLVQDALLAALEQKRDLDESRFLAWASGVIRNRATFLARTAGRRRRRDTREEPVMAVAYFLVLLQPGPNRASEPEHRAAHVSFIETTEAADVVLLGGWFDSRVEDAEAAYLLHVASQAAAERWAARDPCIAHEVFRPRVVTWNLVGVAKSAIDPAFGRGT